MHAWEGKPFEDIAPLTARRDPRRYPLGCVTGDGRTEVIQWFRSMPELSQYLLRMEPQRWGYRQADLIALKAKLEPALTMVDVMGLSEATRAAVNAVTEPAYHILWWGEFNRLAEGSDPWSQRLLTAAEARHLADGPRIDALVSYLRQRARSEWPPPHA
jgi:hypothetical protein